MIPQVLFDAADYLKGKATTVSSGIDARADSGLSENVIIKLLQDAKKWNINSPNADDDNNNNRFWYDCKIDDCFCNIKVSALKSNDNTNAKKAIYYLLTGQEPIGISDKNTIFFDQMRQNENPDESRDYYYFVINKSDLSDVFPVSLKGLAHCQPASANPPFQSNWDKCREPVPRSWQEAKEFLLTQWAISIGNNINNLTQGMPVFYPEYFEDYDWA